VISSFSCFGSARRVRRWSDSRAGCAGLLLAVLGAAACGGAQQAPVVAAKVVVDGPPEVRSDRLPTDAKPLAYSLELTVLPKQDRFSGRAQIVVQLTAASSIIQLHAKDLLVKSVSATAGGATIAGTFEQLTADGVAALRFASSVPAGQVVLELVYEAAFDRQLRGLYRVDSGGESYAFTQFEPISARSAFPCFDEPAWKAHFELWLTVPSDHTAASNTKVIGEEAAGEGLKRVHFAQTPLLPTYLVAFAVGPFDVVDGPAVPASATRDAPVPVRGLATKGKGALLKSALAEVAPQLTALERYFGIAYPFEKIDLVAVPDFGAGAMENVGLITFREYLLLLDPKLATESQRRASAYVMAHELAHQWFGNLVTMNYWDDIWLNEGFATWMGYRIVSELHPQHTADLDFQSRVEEAMSSDSLVSARMIRQPISTTHDIINAFDSITYSKGGGVLAMFERYLGAGVFQAGVQNYVKAHATANASTDDLLDALGASASRDVKTPFTSFLTQVGVPLVESELACSAGSAELRLRQSRYLPIGTSGSGDQRWQIPVCARYEQRGTLKESCTLLAESSGSLAFEGGVCPTWVLPNVDGAGYYRFALPKAELDALRTRAYKRLNASERLSLAQALIAMYAAGKLSAKDALEGIATFTTDSERMVASLPIGFLSYARKRLATDGNRAKLEAYAQKLYTPVRARLGWREQLGESGDSKLLRGQVLEFLAEVGRDPLTRSRFAKLGQDYLGASPDAPVRGDVVPADLADLAVRMFVELGDQAAFDAVQQRLLKTEDALLRNRLLRGLASVTDGDRGAKALALSLDPALRVNEVMIPLRVQFSEPATREAAARYLEQNFDALAKRLPPSATGATPWLYAAFCDEAAATRVETFFASRIQSLPGGPRSLAGALEAIRLCAAGVAAQRPSFEAMFPN
jgi:cytosol alanyl aminopeptidase